MCRECASHNVNNRNAEDVTPEDERVKVLIPVKVGSQQHGTYQIDERFMPEVYTLLSALEKKS